MVFQNAANQRNFKLLTRFFSRAKEEGYVFAYAEDQRMQVGIQQALQEQLNAQGKTVKSLYLDAAADLSLIQRLRKLKQAQQLEGAIIANLYDYISDPDYGQDNLNEINFSREAFYSLEMPILFWISKDTFSLLSNKAPDLYSQRRLAVIDFVAEDRESVAKKLRATTIVIPPAQTSDALQLAASLYAQAKEKRFALKKLAYEYALPYIIALSENFHKEKAFALMKEYQAYWDEKEEELLLAFARVYTHLYEFDQGIYYASKLIAFLSKIPLSNNLYVAYELRARNLKQIGKLQESLTDEQIGAELMLQLQRQNPTQLVYQQNLAVAYVKLGETHTALGDLPKAMSYYEKCTFLFETLHASHPDHLDYQSNLAVAYEKIGDTYRDLGDLPKAMSYYEKYVALSESLHTFNPNHLGYQRGLAVAYERLGVTHSALGDLPKAMSYYEKEVVLFESLYISHPDHLDYQRGLAVAYFKLGEIQLEGSKELEKGKEYLKKSYELVKVLKEKYSDYTQFQQDYEYVANKLRFLEERGE